MKRRVGQNCAWASVLPNSRFINKSCKSFCPVVQDYLFVMAVFIIFTLAVLMLNYIDVLQVAINPG